MSLGTNVSFDSRTRRFTDCHDLGKGYSACVHLPPNSDNVRLPLLLYLTANGARGTFTEAPALAAWAGVGLVLADTLDSSAPSPAGKCIRDEFITVFLIAPRSTFVIDPNVVAEAVKKGLSNYKSDPGRVYLTGYSMGCRGMLRALVHHPNLFAAAFGAAGYAEKKGNHYIAFNRETPTFDKLSAASSVPVLLAYSPQDGVNPAANTLETHQALIMLKKSPFSIPYDGLSHDDMASEPFRDVNLYKWLLQHCRQPEA